MLVATATVLLLQAGPTASTTQVASHYERFARAVSDLPAPVFDLFYAVRASVHCFSPEGGPVALPTLTSYSLVTPAMLDSLRDNFEIVSYQVLPGDYRLEVAGRFVPKVRYLATYAVVKVWRGGEWVWLESYVPAFWLCTRPDPPDAIPLPTSYPALVEVPAAARAEVKTWLELKIPPGASRGFYYGRWLRDPWPQQYWLDFEDRSAEGDEVWYFQSPDDSLNAHHCKEGLAIVCEGEPVALLVKAGENQPIW